MSVQPARHQLPVRAHVILRDGDRVLLSLRAPHLPGGGRWQLPGGHLEPDESVLECAVRETGEEVGAGIAPGSLRLVHTRHVFTRSGASRLALFFEAAEWRGDPVNREPELCRAVGFFPLGALPRPMVGYMAAALAGYLRHEPFGVSRPAP
jgi:8-oxo-dGTP diphosphatase